MGADRAIPESTTLDSPSFADTAAGFFRDLQARICTAFESLETTQRFEARGWNRPAGHPLQGGGEIRLMRGEVFEKVGVNFSHVWGSIGPQFRGQIPGAMESDGAFIGTGLSLVAHMFNPYVP